MKMEEALIKELILEKKTDKCASPRPLDQVKDLSYQNQTMVTAPISQSYNYGHIFCPHCLQIINNFIIIHFSSKLIII